MTQRLANAARPIWATSRFDISLQQPVVMGIVNVTPDSFSDGGQHADTDSALRHAERLLREGAGILDIGGESTRPGSPPLPLEDERRRVLPVLREVLRWGVPVSLDTYKPALMDEALGLGVDIVNDIRALREPGAVELVTRHGRCGVCLMHMHRDPATMQTAPLEGDAVPQVLSFLQQQTDILCGSGVDSARIVWDPGIGFGKTPAQNFALLARQRELLAAGRPLLVGWSRKSSLGVATGLPVDDRLVPSVAAAVLAAERGARVLRVHDVRETVAALAVWRAMREQDRPGHTQANDRLEEASR